MFHGEGTIWGLKGVWNLDIVQWRSDYCECLANKSSDQIYDSGMLEGFRLKCERNGRQEETILLVRAKINIA